MPTPLASAAAPARPDHSSAPEASFGELGVPEVISRALAARGIDAPFPIQTATLPDSLDGRDVLGRGRTGSGKTIAFAIPTVVAAAERHAHRKPAESRRPSALVLVPTRELAAQVAETMIPMANALKVSLTVIHGGVAMGPQIKALGRGVDIVVACPGRLEDLMRQGHCRLDRVRVTVLDEADHMADLGFLPVVKRLLDQTPRDCQRLLFSATMDNGVDVLVKRYLHDPVVHAVDSAESPVPDMQHHVFAVDAGDKGAVVQELAGGEGRTLLFTRTKHGAKKLAQNLSRSGIPAVELHGNLSQNARTRNLDQFASGEARVLVATDIAARGIHVDEIGLVVHVDPPAEHKAYLHRSGRTARAGARGVVVTIMTPDQRRDVDDLTKRAKIQPRHDKVRPGHPLLVEIVGEPAPRVHRPAPVAPTVTPTSRSRKRPNRAGNRPGPRGA